MKKYYDVTMVISPEMMVYKDRAAKRPIFSEAGSIDRGDSTNETNVSFNVHTGTHMDFPRHVSNRGKTSSTFAFDAFFKREVIVVDLTNLKKMITADDLKPFPIQPGDFLLFKTTNSKDVTFNTKFVYVSEDAARYLLAKKVSGVGLDALGIERDQPGHPTHHLLLDNGIHIVEGLALKKVPSGRYIMYALPLKLTNVDGLPLSIILEKY